MTDTDYKSKYEELCKKLMHEFTPGGSEFWMDPDRCIDFAKLNIESARKMRRIIADRNRRLNRSRLLRWLWNRVDRKHKEERNAST